jgi:polar amino acid transport system substrate-binding protein
MTMTPLSRRGLIGMAAALMTTAGAVAAQAETTLERARKNGYVRVGFANESPFAYATPDGKLTGEAPEIAKVILKKMGIPQIDGVLTEFGSLIPGLQAGRFDIIAAGMFVTPARCGQILFSEPTYGIGEDLLVPKGNPKKLKDYGSIAANRRLKLAVEAGAIEMTYAQKAGVGLSQLVILPDQSSLVKAVQSGRADAASLTALSVEDMARKNTGVEALPPFDTVAGKSVVGEGAFGFRKSDTDFVKAFDAQLKSFIGSPEHIALVTPFGFGKGFLPTKTTAELCAGH